MSTTHKLPPSPLNKFHNAPFFPCSNYCRKSVGKCIWRYIVPSEMFFEVWTNHDDYIFPGWRVKLQNVGATL